MTLIVGLGNPTEKYKNNRHNVGFMVIDKLIDNLNATNISKSSFKGELYKTKNLLLLKPLTYMNLSGESVINVVNYYKIENIVVVHDELDIPLGSLRVKLGGSSGGHNGIKSIDQHFGNEYERLRVGIGRPEFKSDVVKHVLSDFSKNESECLKKVIESASKISQDMANLEIKEINQKYSLKKSICT